MRDIRPTAEQIPPKVWRVVVKRMGTEIIAVPETYRGDDGKIHIDARLLDDVVARLLTLLRRLGVAESVEDDAPWEKAADWWKNSR